VLLWHQGTTIRLEPAIVPSRAIRRADPGRVRETHELVSRQGLRRGRPVRCLDANAGCDVRQ
jgi:hypothetical protein